ncbi:MAG: MBL fold metallo-hydrolase [Moorea sp. SIO2B7]|nr:MBL fold metallo-hydrolase [Moorena sp. SIO2B7]
METNPSSEFVVQFWGVRGSIPSPGPTTVRYGGNTSCLEIRADGKRLIFDGGTGLRMLGKTLEPQMPIEAYMFFTHYHWDHIQGVPFFLPVFNKGNCLYIHGQVPQEGELMKLKEHFYKRVLHTNSPVPVREIEADLKFRDIVCGETFNVGDITLETRPLNHPNGAMGYRISWQGHSIVYVTDTEHYPDRFDENVLHLAEGADIFIYDAMYTDEEYHNPKSSRVGWGHSTWQEGVKIAKEVGVKKLGIFHHDPNHTDDFLDEIGIQVKDAFEGAFMAREGLIVSAI